MTREVIAAYNMIISGNNSCVYLFIAVYSMIISGNNSIIKVLIAAYNTIISDNNTAIPTIKHDSPTLLRTQCDHSSNQYKNTHNSNNKGCQRINFRRYTQTNTRKN